MKKNFTEPEMEVVRFDAQEVFTAYSCTEDGCPGNAPCVIVDPD